MFDGKAGRMKGKEGRKERRKEGKEIKRKEGLYKYSK